MIVGMAISKRTDLVKLIARCEDDGRKEKVEEELIVKADSTLN